MAACDGRVPHAGEVVTGGWGAPRKRPPSNDPERPPKGLASGTLANPQRVQVEIVLPPLDFTCTGCKCPHHQKETSD